MVYQHLWTVPEEVCKPDDLVTWELDWVLARDQHLALDSRQADGEADVDGDPVQGDHTPGGSDGQTSIIVITLPELKPCARFI